MTTTNTFADVRSSDLVKLPAPAGHLSAYVETATTITDDDGDLVRVTGRLHFDAASPVEVLASVED